MPVGAPEADVVGIDAFGRAHRQPAGGGTGGDVSSSITSSNDGSISIFDGTTGKLIKQSEVIINDPFTKIDLPTGYDINILTPYAANSAQFQIKSFSSGNTQTLCWGCKFDDNFFQIISGSPAGRVIFYLTNDFGNLKFYRSISNPGPGSVLNPTVDFEVVWRINNTSFEVAGIFQSFGTNNFQSSTTEFNNATLVDFTGANVVGLQSGGDVNSSITSSNNGEIAVFDGTTAKVIKNSNITALTDEIDFVGPLSRTKITNNAYNFKDQSSARIAHNIGTLDGNTNQLFGICFGGEINKDAGITANNPFVYLIIYYVDGFGADAIRPVRHIKKVDCVPGTTYNINDFDKVYSIRSDNDIFELESNLQSQGTNNFQNSTTQFNNATLVDFTGANVVGLPPPGGDVSSSVGAVLDNQICRFDGTTGKLIQNGLATLSDTGQLDTTSITTLTITIDPAGTLNAQNVNNFDTSLTNFTNATLNCTNTTVNSLANNPTADRVVTLDGSGILTERNITTNPWYDQNLNSGSNVVFNLIQVESFVHPSSLPISVLGGFNVLLGGINVAAGDITGATNVNTSNLFSQGTNNFQNSTTQFNNATSVDFTGATVIGLPSGDMVGPLASTDNALCRFDGITGKLVQNSSATLGDTGDLNLTGSLTATDLNADNLTIIGGTKNLSGGITNFNNCTLQCATTTINNPNLDDTIRTFVTLDGADQITKTIIEPLRGAIHLELLYTRTFFVVNQWEALASLDWVNNSLVNINASSFNFFQLRVNGLTTQSCVVSVAASISYRGSNASNNIYQASIFKDGVEIPCTTQYLSTTESTLVASTTLHCMTTAGNADVFDIRVRNTTDLDSINIERASLDFFRVSD